MLRLKLLGLLMMLPMLLGWAVVENSGYFDDDENEDKNANASSSDTADLETGFE